VKKCMKISIVGHNLLAMSLVMVVILFCVVNNLGLNLAEKLELFYLH
jgi:hypothetical protein